MAKTKTKEERPKSVTPITTEQLKEIGNYASNTKDKRFKRLEERLLTYNFLDSIPQALEDLRFEDVKSYVYYASVFLSLYDRHKANEKRFELEEKRLEAMQKDKTQDVLEENAPYHNLIELEFNIHNN